MASMLANKIALVTGGSRGIGRATALALARQGAEVIVHYGRSESSAQAVAAEIREAGGTAHLVQADLGRPEAGHELAQAVRAAVGENIDIVVANAGIGEPARIEDVTVADFDELFAVNVRAPFFLVQQLLPVLKEGASVVLTSSLSARAAGGGLAVYGATKGAVDSLMTHLAADLGPRGIRVNCVAPGIVHTDMSAYAGTEAGHALACSVQALKRVAQPEDIADITVFLASEQSRWITGTTLYADGGTHLGMTAS
ncbi:SDR family NAD(P)-dependent oxidoreductase [Streptomyces sp. NPDC048305]|uniref:SDR family NAD(P)-dependent oxidoreductase n=1 Tax=Streptomyces sp. NPDC048305 TaxID=3365532 RepID=UPI00372453DC